MGHCPEPVVTALQQEVGRLLHCFNYATPVRAEFFEAVATTPPESLQTFQMHTTVARRRRQPFAWPAPTPSATRSSPSTARGSFYGAWHGRTLGAMSLMGRFPQKHGYGPFLPGVLHSPKRLELAGGAAPSGSPATAARWRAPASWTGSTSSRPSSRWPPPRRGTGQGPGHQDQAGPGHRAQAAGGHGRPGPAGRRRRSHPAPHSPVDDPRGPGPPRRALLDDALTEIEAAEGLA